MLYNFYYYIRLQTKYKIMAADLKQTNGIDMKFGHPKGLWYMFGTEMWERFGYYLMLGIFSLYMIDGWNNGGMGFSADTKSDIYGTYLGLVYLTPFIGGLIADRLLGYRRSIIIGGLMMACGYFFLSVHSTTTFYLALLLIILGNGFFKPNISTLVGSLYSEDSLKDKKDAGFNIFYMGINIGAFICNFVAAYMRINYGWGAAFAAAGVGMLVGVVIFILGNKHIKSYDVVKPLQDGDMSTGKILGLTVLPMFLFGTLGYMLPGNFLGSDTNDAFIIGCLPVIGFFIYLAFKSEAKESRAIKALLAVFTCVILFFAIFHQNGDALTIWAEDHTDREMSAGVAGVADKAEMAQEIYNNPITREIKVGDLEKKEIIPSDSTRHLDSTMLLDSVGYFMLKKAGDFLEKNTKDELINIKDYSKILSTYEKSILYAANLPKNALINPNTSNTVIDSNLINVKSLLSTPKNELPLVFTNKKNFKLLKIGIEKKINNSDSLLQELLIKRLSMPDTLFYYKNLSLQKKINNSLDLQKKQLDTKIEIYEKEITSHRNYLSNVTKIVDIKSKEKPINSEKNLKLYSTELYQSINPFWVVLLTPVMVGIWGFFRRRKREPSTPTKIFIGLIITALSALVMVGAVFATNDMTGKASSLWLLASYGVITIGELCLSPMGLSLVSKLSPPRITALMMGGFFLAISVGNKLSGMLSSLWETTEQKENFFYLNFALVMAAAIILFAMLRWLNRVMKENNVL
jgi:dipeptide/tripeptide permease